VALICGFADTLICKFMRLPPL